MHSGQAEVGSRAIDVAYAIDRAYAPWAATSMLSLVERHAAGALRFHVLHACELRDDDVERLAAVAAVGGSPLTVHHVPRERVEALPAIDRFGTVVWLRFLLPELLPDCDRVLYLDADTYAAQAIDGLWETELDGTSIAAAPNVVDPAVHDHVRSLGLDPRRFFNSGVLLLDLREMARRDSVTQLLRFATDNAAKLWWPDQDALNVVFAEDWHPLELRWNVQNSVIYWRRWAEDIAGSAAVRAATRDPGIVHFEGPSFVKPWHALCGHPWRAAYRETFARTPWAGRPLEDDQLAVRLLARLPFHVRTRAYVRLRER